MPLVHNCVPNVSGLTIEALACQYDFLLPVRLLRNWGQHAAALAGMASANGDRVVTIDEDVQQDPADVCKMLNCAVKGSCCRTQSWQRGARRVLNEPQTAVR